MGADQLQDEGEEMVRKFFDWFYWFIQVGSLLAYTVVAYVQQEVSFFYGYLIASVSIVFATILLVIGRKHYILHPPQGNYLADTLRIIGGGLRDKLCCKKDPSLTHWLDGAKDSLGGKYSQEMVEGVKSVVRLLPIFLAFIFYWTIYGQVSKRTGNELLPDFEVTEEHIETDTHPQQQLPSRRQKFVNSSFHCLRSLLYFSA